MTKPFPRHPQLTGNYAPLRMEGDAHDLIVRGELPDGLDGSLFRIGPNPQYPPRDRNHHWFAGDGMVHAIHLEEGRARYQNRWVRTPKFNAERAAGTSLYGTFGNPMTSDASVAGKDSGLANTNIVCHAGRLLALEEAHPPFEMSYENLESRGYHTFGGKLTGSKMTAHPKLDPETGEMLFFGYSTGGYFTDQMTFHVVNTAGEITRADTFKTPYSSMVHDFIVTQKHIVFPILPLTGSLERAMEGKSPFAWEPETSGWLGVMARDASIESIKWIEIPACYVFHVLNAFDTPDGLAADVMKYDAAPLFPHADGTPGDPTLTQSFLQRWSIDIDTGTMRETQLDDRPGEFPRVDDRRAGLPYRHGWFAAIEARTPGDRGVWTEYVHVDLKRQTRTIWSDGSDTHLSEPVFVPAHTDAAEGDGWIMGTAFRAAENRSDLLVFAATDLDSGPVATVELPHRIPHGFHGNWVDAPM